MVQSPVNIGQVLPAGTSWEIFDELYRIHLPESDFSTRNFQFVFVDISRAYPYPLVRVVYEDRAGDKSGGLRLDVGKCVFLDHFDEKEKETDAQQFAPKIAAYVASAVQEILRTS